jgi:hypothetical protein
VELVVEFDALAEPGTMRKSGKQLGKSVSYLSVICAETCIRFSRGVAYCKSDSPEKQTYIYIYIYTKITPTTILLHSSCYVCIHRVRTHMQASGFIPGAVLQSSIRAPPHSFVVRNNGPIQKEN